MVPMRRVVLCTLLSLGAPVALRAQEATPKPAPDPAWLVKRYFVDRAFPGQSAYLAGEMAEQDIGRTVGSMLPAGFGVTYRRIMGDSAKAVYAVMVVGQGQITDSYAYLQKDSLGWKLAAVRSLKLTRDFTNAIRVLRQQQNLPDTTRMTFLNMQLLAAPDTALRKILRERRQSFETLVSAYHAQRADTVAVSPAGLPLPGTEWGPVQRRLATLHLTSIYREPRLPGCTFIVIGAQGYSAAGYIHDDGGCHPPPISPDHFIYVEKIVPGWWVYKTS